MMCFTPTRCIYSHPPADILVTAVVIIQHYFYIFLYLFIHFYIYRTLAPVLASSLFMFLVL